MVLFKKINILLNKSGNCINIYLFLKKKLKFNAIILSAAAIRIRYNQQVRNEYLRF